MKNNLKILGLIPARGGSKGVPRKNIKDLCGKPLIAYTIVEAKKSKYIDKLIVSTDDQEIADVAKKWGVDVPFLRPAELANDTARALSVIRHGIETMEALDDCRYDLVVYLEPPSPLRTVSDIDTAIEMYFRETPAPDCVVAVKEANQYHPITMKKIENNRLLPFYMEEPEGLPRQLFAPKAYMRNGAMYVFRRDNILNGVMYGKNIVPYVMPEEKSVCIDDMNDWYAAEARISNSFGKEAK